MVKILPFLWSLSMFAAPACAESGISGAWMTGEKKATVEITRTDDGWIGRIVALKEPLTPEGEEKTDYKNPDPSRRKDPIIGLRILWGFKAKGANTWSGGFVYDAETGKTYHATLTLKNDQLLLRGSLDRWGMAGRSVTWTRPTKEKSP
ncbi:MAG: DUF2147 domain-containing protein [Kiritimatiellia bacterium]|nr:DUF2147 domain-containing protein [Kiritimatiellia bacterium]